MIGSGLLGIPIIFAIAIHSIYNLYKSKINTPCTRILYITFFLFYWITCIGYALFRINLIIPMGSIVNCKYGVYLTTNSLFVAKIILFTIFLLKIDFAFHSSALGYSRIFLSIIWSVYTIGICILNAMFMYVTWDLIVFVESSYLNGTISIGMCTTGVNVTTNYTYVVGCIFLGDAFFSIVVCLLFVYKLYKVKY